MPRSDRGYYAPHHQDPVSNKYSTYRPAVSVPGHHSTQQQAPAPERQLSSSVPTVNAGYRAGVCYICSYSKENNEIVSIYHRHFSSLRLREMLGVEGTEKCYLCPSCKSRHGSYPEDRVKIVVSDSTLHQFFAPPNYEDKPPYKGDTMHTDYITVPGGCIDELYNAFRLDQKLLPAAKPLDVVLVMGYNDLVKGHSRQFIMDCFEVFSELVLRLAKQNHPDIPNTLAIASIMYAPQLSWFPDNGPEPLNYQNQMEKIDWLNARIHELNLKNSCPSYPRFHTYGVRTATRSTHDRYGYLHQYKVKSHRWEHWREQTRSNMLHLRNDRVFKMGTAVNNYFILKT